MQQVRVQAALVALVVFGGCKPDENNSSSSSGGTPAAGEERGPCLAGGACNAGLVCLSEVCVRLPDGGTGSSSSGAVSGGGSSSSPVVSSGGVASSGTAGSSGGTASSGAASSGAASSSGGAQSGVFIPGAAAPACTRVSVNGVTPTDAPLRPGDMVELAPPTGVVAPVAWRALRLPYGSRVTPLPERTAGHVRLTTLDPFGEGGLDVPGYYVFEAAQATDGGTTGAVACSLLVVPAQGLYVTVNWDTAVDVDAHVLRRDSQDRFCDTKATGSMAGPVAVSGTCADNDANACTYSNCKPNGATVLDWDGVAGRSAGDPALAHDGTERGPETAFIPAPQPGAYLLALHLFSLHGLTGTVARVQIYVAGWLRAELVQPMVTDNQYQPMALINWPATGDVCVTDARDAAAVARCSTTAACTTAACSQCTDDNGCGAGTRCNTSTAQCQGLAAAPCTDNAACGALACIPAYGECAADLCTNCATNAICQPEVRVCVPRPPVCTETDEPNNTLADALSFTGTGTTFTLDSTMCRGDLDVATLTVTAPGLLVVEAADTGGSGGWQHTVALWQGGAQLASSSFAASAHVAVGTVEVHISTPLTAFEDQVSYQATAALYDVPACGAEPGEPNDTLQDATPLAIGVNGAVGVLCATDMVDFYEVTQPAGQRLEVTLAGLPAGPGPQVEALDAAGATLITTGFGTITVSETAAERQVFLRVFEDFASGTEEAYTLRVEAKTPPTCHDTATEPNNSLAEAVPLPSASFGAVACDRQDTDHYWFTTGAAGSLRITLAMPAGLDLDMRVYNAAGTLVGSATTATNPEVLAVTSASAGRHTLAVLPYTSAGAAYPAEYTLTVESPSLILGGGASSSSGPASGASGGSSAGASSAGASSTPAASSGAGASSGYGSSAAPPASSASGPAPSSSN